MEYYLVKIIKYPNTIEDIKNAPIQECKGLKEVRELCGGKLHYSRNADAYMGINGNIQYVAIKEAQV